MTWVHIPSENCIFSPEQEEVSSLGNSSGINVSALSKLTPTVNQCLCNDKKTAFYQSSPSGIMSAPSTVIHGESVLTSSLEDSPVKTSPTQEHDKAFLAHAQAYGQSLLVSLAKYDPVTHSLKTPQLSLIEGLNESLATLPGWGMMHDGVVSGLMTSVHHTSGKGSGYWPTPRKREDNSYQQKNGKTYPTLTGMVKMFPTPTIHGNYNQKGLSKTSGDGLITFLRKIATPTARDFRSGKASEKTMNRNSRPLSEQIGGLLNPAWVCWLMGWPIVWTDLGIVSQETYREWFKECQSALRRFKH